MKNVKKEGDGILTTFKKIATTLGIAFGVQQIIQFGREAVALAAKGEGIRRAFAKLNDPNLLSGLRRATRGTVTDLELMRSAIRARNFNVPLEKLATFFEFATKRSIETGESVDYLVDSIVDGIGRKSTLVLDNLGISATELQAEIKKTGDFGEAAANIISRELEKTGEVADTTATQIARLNAQWENFKERSGNVIGKVLVDIADSLGIINKNQGAIDEFRRSIEELKGAELNDKLVATYAEIESIKRRQIQLSRLEQQLAKEAVGLEGDKLKQSRALREQVFKEQAASRDNLRNQYDFIRVLKQELDLRGQIVEETGEIEFYTPDQIKRIVDASKAQERQIVTINTLDRDWETPE
jgi:hypothetical protein